MSDAATTSLLRRLNATQMRHAVAFKTAVVELLAALDVTAGGLSTDRSHWERQKDAENAVRRTLKNV